MDEHRRKGAGRLATVRAADDHNNHGRSRGLGSRLHHIVHSIATNSRSLAAYRKAPRAFLWRHQIDANQPDGAAALTALNSLVEARAQVDAKAQVRAADPTGEAGARSGVVVAPSEIHGDGLFTERELGGGETICAAGVNNQVSFPLSKVNRSATPNAEIVERDGQSVLATLTPILPGDEIVANYPFDEEVEPALRNPLPPRSG